MCNGTRFPKEVTYMRNHILSKSKRSYLDIDAKWLSKYVGYELGNVYDCSVAQLSKDHNHMDKIQHW